MRSFIIVEGLVVTGFSFVLAYLVRGSYYVVPAAALFFFLVLPVLFLANDRLGLVSKDDVGAVGKYLGVTDIILFIYAVYQIFSVQSYPSIITAVVSFVLYDVATILVFERFSGRSFKDFILVVEGEKGRKNLQKFE